MFLEETIEPKRRKKGDALTDTCGMKFSIAPRIHDRILLYNDT